MEEAGNIPNFGNWKGGTKDVWEIARETLVLSPPTNIRFKRSRVACQGVERKKKAKFPKFQLDSPLEGGSQEDIDEQQRVAIIKQRMDLDAVTQPIPSTRIETSQNKFLERESIEDLESAMDELEEIIQTQERDDTILQAIVGESELDSADKDVKPIGEITVEDCNRESQQEGEEIQGRSEYKDYTNLY